MIKIAPSILSADFSRLAEELMRIEKAGADLVHIDVMDGHFVPNITLGPPIVKSIKKVTKLPFDVHLMIEEPDKYIDSFIDAGADTITVHVEACTHLQRTLEKIRQRGIKAAVALNPATSLSTLEWVLNDLDMILLMSVNPGFSGQKFIKSVTDKIRKLKEMMDSRGIRKSIQVDGGIDTSNIYHVTKAGADIIVSGSTIFKAHDASEIINELKEKACKIIR